MHLYQHAQIDPRRPAVIMTQSGETLTYGELDAATNRVAQLFRKSGLKPGDVIAVLLKNGPNFPIAYWGAQRAGLMTAPISTHLKAEEAAYIVRDCRAKVLVTSADANEAALELAARRHELTPHLKALYFAGGEVPESAASWEDALAQMPATRIPDEISGYYLVYSGGTTGRPKGVVLPFTPGPIEDDSPMEAMVRATNPGPSVSLIPAPLYHAAPLFISIMAHRTGSTAVIMERFDPEAMLQAIQTWKVTHVQTVPTMFVRLLALPEEVRRTYDTRSLVRVAHAAAPCPVSVKRKMIEWLGPIIHESYSGSEANGQCSITSEEWLRKPGSVGRANWGVLHICDEDGNELPPGTPGLIYFEGAQAFTYRNDPEKTAKSRHPKYETWSTLGDIGYVDEDGYLFLCDRKDFMIISGGVNIYPQAVENLLIDHPKVLDAAVIGVPNADFGEEVKAVVQPANWADASDDFAAELIAYCRAHTSKLNCPRSVDFVHELPRLPTGKLAKHEVRRRYWPDGQVIAGDPRTTPRA